MAKLSLCMIVKNEEKYLRDCLESVKDVVNEMVIVDTGSTDRTIEIAKEYGAEIFHFEWINDFSAARNYSLSKCTGEWILYLDADERLNRESVRELKKITSTNKKLSVYCNVYNVDEINKKPNLMKYTRLFKNSPGIEFRGRAHEQIEKSLEEKNYQVINSKITITHIGYNLERDGLKQKAKRNLLLLLEDYKTGKSSYTAFQLGNTYSILGDKINAAEYYSIALKDPKLSDSYFAISSAYVAEYELNNKNNQQALELLEKGLKKNPNHPLLNYVGSDILFRLGNGKLAVDLCKKAYEENKKNLESTEALTALDVRLDSEEVLYHGLKISIDKNINEGLLYFLEAMERDFDKKDYTFNDEVDFLVAIAQNKILENEQFSIFNKLLNKKNMDFYLDLISNYSNGEVKIKLLNLAAEKFKDDIKIKNKLGLALSKHGKINEAISLFEKSLREFNDEPTPVFYLASLYFEKNDFDKLNLLLDDSKKRFADNPLILKHILDFERKTRDMIAAKKK